MKLKIFVILIAMIFSQGISIANADENKLAQDKEKKITKQTSQMIAINTADIKTLQKLPGIGKAKAQAIYDFRLQHGEFSSLDELVAVKGLSEKTVTKFASMITF